MPRDSSYRLNRFRSFSIFAFLLVLAFRAYQELGTDDTVGMRVAEPEGEELPPLGY
jgi:multicomponent Na+:H+ antiporter subunit C